MTLNLSHSFFVLCSLSSKEAEFQAWKRRKNYDPRRSASKRTNPAANQQPPVTNHRKVSSPPTPIRRGTITIPRTVNGRPHPAASLMSTEPFSSQDANLLRSASFHYPDGMSRVQLNVYTSEDDDDSQTGGGERGEFPSGLYEVNEDELILTIGGNNDCGSSGGAASMVSYNPKFSSASESGNRTISPNSISHWPQSTHPMVMPSSTSHTKLMRSSPSRGSSSKLEALDNLVISTIFSVSTKLCLTSGKLMRRLHEQTTDKEQLDYLDTLVGIVVEALILFC